MKSCFSGYLGGAVRLVNRVIGDNTNMDIVTGVNVPMLVETFMARDDNPQHKN